MPSRRAFIATATAILVAPLAADGERVAVVEGLSEGDDVAVSAVSKLSDGAAVKIAPSGEPAAASVGQLN